MRVQTLVVTIQQTDHSLPGAMNIQTDAVVGNQCGKDAVEEFDHNGHRILFLSSSQRGVGTNRNEVLLRAEGDICVLADDDMTFFDGYADTVQKWFEKLPQADILAFNLAGGRKRFCNTAVRRVHRFNYGKYGAARLALRTRAVRFSGVMFHTMFGGGCEYSCGEDSLFLRDCLKKGLKVYGVPEAIASIEDGNSTWFSAYNEKFFFDKGVLYYALNKRWCRLIALYNCLRHRKRYKEFGWRNAYSQMLKGIRSVT